MTGCRGRAKRYLSLGGVVMELSSSTHAKSADPLDDWVGRVLAEYAQRALPAPLDPRLSLRDDLAVESLSLVSLVVRLGDELGVDAADESLELERLLTVGDLLALAHRLEQRGGAPARATGHAPG
jgi:acyl carrier protein